MQKLKANELVEYLNDILKHDPDSMYELFSHRVMVSPEMSKSVNGTSCPNEHYSLGILGILNGLCDGDIAAEVNSAEEGEKYIVNNLSRFVVATNSEDEWINGVRFAVL